MGLSGLIVLAFRRDAPHMVMWGFLIAYWMIGGIIQDIAGNNSIPWPDMGMASLVGLFAAYVFSKTGNVRFVFILAFMTLTFINAMWYAVLVDYGTPRVFHRSIYQNTTYLLFFASLFALCSPDARGSYDRVRDIFTRVTRRTHI